MRRALLSLGIVVFGGASAKAQLFRERLIGDPYGQFGSQVAVIGDVDGDGIEDYAVSEPVFHLTSASDEGLVALYSGSDSHHLFSIAGAQGDMLGTSLAPVGDVDGDGIPDLAIGATGHMANFHLDAGYAAVMSGATGGFLWMVEGSNDFEIVGTCVSGAGDLDGDGRPEVLVGTGLDHLFVVDHSGNVLRTISGGLLFGYTVLGLGDVDGDGVPDFAAGEPWYNASGSQPRRGRVHVYSGATASQLYAVVGDANNDYLGRTLARLGDLNADGIDDFIAASYVSSQGGNQSGLVRVLSGKDGSTLFKRNGSAASKWFGYAVAGCRDLDRDGIPDFAVGIPGVPTTGSNGLGEVQLFSGADAHVLYDFLGQASGSATNVALGFAVASGDFNADGAPDFLFGDPVYDDSSLGGPVGAVEVYLGCPAFSQSYGSGWPGTIGIPTLTLSDDPALGATISIDLGNSLGTTTPGLLVVGIASASIPLTSGATLLVDPLLFVPLTIPPGGASLTGSIPVDPTLCFTRLFVQGVEFDPGAAGLLSFTSGLELSIGFDL